MRFFVYIFAILAILSGAAQACIGGGGSQCCPPAQPSCGNPCGGGGGPAGLFGAFGGRKK